MKKCVKILLILAALVGVERFCYWQTAGFRLDKIRSEMTPSAGSYESEVLNQPFTFLGSGVQCYAFLSQDGTTVLKVFKHYHSWPHNALLKQIDLPFTAKVLRAREQRMQHIFGSCKIAYEDYQEETGMIYLHLDRTEHFKRSVTLVDKIGIAHQVDLDSVAFALQKRADLVFPHLDALMKKGDLKGAQQAIDSLLGLIQRRCQKGIANSDPIVRRNFGFIEGSAVEIDIGSFAKNPFLQKPYAIKRELFYETLELQEWLQKYPELLEHFQTQINLLLHEN